jgi:exoribonuclease-2
MQPTTSSLVLYKIHPARVIAIGDKIEIELEDGKGKRVRPKDISLLHPGPISSLNELIQPQGDIDEARELLEGSETNLAELAELIYGEFTPATAWASWQLLHEGLYFEGGLDSIRARSSEQIESDLKEQKAKATAEREMEESLARIKRGEIIEQDRKRLAEVERLALGQSEQSTTLKALGHQVSAENGHRLLLSTGYWQGDFNPYPQRLSLPLDDPDITIPELPEEERLDLTHLDAYAIDDEQTADPDDALSIDGDRLWVHVADVAALVVPDSELDLEARARGTNLYLPERIIHMLPTAITAKLGLGLQQMSPALSIGFMVNPEGEPVDINITPSWIKARRESYGEIDKRIEQEPFATMSQIARRSRQRCKEAGASDIDLPEVSVRVIEGRVVITPQERSASRKMVAAAMILAGEATARYALEHDIPIPFATQPPPDERQQPQGMAAMYAYRRQFKPSQFSTQEAPHSGLGLEVYSRATSPLRRYLDLVNQQQIRAYLQGDEVLTQDAVAERIVAAVSASRATRRAERVSNNHWKMVYLQQNPGWQGSGVVMAMTERRATVMVPELALETKIRLEREVELDTELQIGVREVDLPDLTAWFRVIDGV